MVVKGIIEEIVDTYQAKVRMPYFNKAEYSTLSTNLEDLSVAGICTLPNSTTNYQIGDIVIVAFDEGYANRPIILGQLQRAARPTVNPQINADVLTARVEAKLPYETSIGNVSAKEIACLKGINENLKFQLEILNARVAKLEEQINNK